MYHPNRLLVSIPIALSILWPAAAYSADAVINNTASATRLYSEADIRNAKPLVNPLAAPDASAARAQGAPTDLTPGSTGGGASAGGSARAFGSFGIPYTSTRVQQGGTNQTSASAGFAYLASTYPYRAVGKLLLAGGGYCSASVIRTGIIVTAAHCIQNFGSGNTVFGGYQFYPGHDGRTGSTVTQQRPYGFWNWRTLVRPASWANGTDVGCGAARNNDLAVIALQRNSSNQLIGQLTGALGYGWNSPSFVSSSKTGNLAVAATSTLGYPFLIDGGRILQRADGPTYLTTINCDGTDPLQYWQGNNFTGGSSGGPWVVNFVSFNPVLSGGAVIGTHPGTWVVGVTSWGTADPNAPKDNYSSRFGQNSRYPLAAYDSPSRGAGNIASLLTTLCNAPAGAPFVGSYEANGWCN